MLYLVANLYSDLHLFMCATCVCDFITLSFLCKRQDNVSENVYSSMYLSSACHGIFCVSQTKKY